MRNRWKAHLVVGICLVISLMQTARVQAQFGRYVPPYRRAYGVGVRRGPYVIVPTIAGPRYYLANPHGGYLNGVANVIDARGKYGMNYQRARLENQRVEQEKIRTKRMLMDARRYERSLRPTANQIREAKQREALRRALNDPPLTEILSASSLNTILVNLQQHQIRGHYGSAVPLRSSILKEINVTSSTGGNIAIFRDGGKLQWPQPLQATAYGKSRKALDRLTLQVVKEAQQGAIQRKTLDKMKTHVETIYQTLQGNARDMALGDVIQAQRFINQLKAGIRGLQDPHVARYFNQKWSARGNDVRELVKNLTEDGLRFAPAVRGNETSYRALHHSLVTYQYSVTALLESRGASPSRNPRR